MTKNLRLHGAGFIIGLLLILAFSMSSCSSENSTKPANTITEGESLTIPISEVGEEPVFYPAKVDGVDMEVIAVKDSESGKIRTAFNTCQVCYDSGKGYYKYDGELLVCQNCQNSFTVDQVETKGGGCNPFPIFEGDKKTGEEAVEIPYKFLSESKKIFADWKA